MQCEQTRENLVALLHHELPAEQQEALQQHLLDCAACRQEFENSRNVEQSLRHLVPMEPSAEKRAAFQRRLRETLDRQAITETSTPNPGQWNLLIAPPQQPLLPAEQQRQGAQSGAPRASKRGSKPHVAALSPAARAISARLKGSSEPALRVFQWTLIGLILALLCAAGFIVWKRPFALSPRPTETPRVLRLAGQRLEERRLAKARGKVTETFLKKYQAQLGESLSDQTLPCLLHFDPRTGEACLVLYRKADISKLRASNDVEELIFDDMLRRSDPATPADGVHTLPAAMVERIIGVDNRAAIVTLDSRIEIWASARLEQYLDGPLRFDPVALGEMAFSRGLPPDREQPSFSNH